ncbi:MAG TPA: methyltransferase domain-containing protein [Anaerolineae bacterium]|nr:methyltransferase domain-containing protein [Anaerolineae bacterium]
MTSPTHDPLRPARSEAAAAWASRVRAERAQVERLREVEDPADFYAPMARHFGQHPERTDDPSAEAVLALARSDETWLDIGAGGGRYALPLALRVARVHAVEPSPSMRAVLRAGMTEHAIDNIDVIARRWPLGADAPAANVALLAHLGYDVEDFDTWLDAAEESASRRCVVVMRAGDSTSAGHVLWHEIHGERRVPYPTLRELLVLLLARGALPEVMLAQRQGWGYASRDELLEASRRQLWLRPGSAKDRHLQQLLQERAVERGGSWSLDPRPTCDGIVTWNVAPGAEGRNGLDAALALS